MSRASSCSTPTSPAGSRSCAARNRRCGDRKRSAAWSRSAAQRQAPAARRHSSRAAATTAWRGAARTKLGDADRGISLGVAGQRSDGIDSFRRRRRQGRLQQRRAARLRPLPADPSSAGRRVRLRAIGARANSTASIPITFPHADTLDESTQPAGRGAAVCRSWAARQKLCRRLGQPARLVQPQLRRR